MTAQAQKSTSPQPEPSRPAIDVQILLSTIEADSWAAAAIATELRRHQVGDIRRLRLASSLLKAAMREMFFAQKPEAELDTTLSLRLSE